MTRAAYAFLAALAVAGAFIWGNWVGHRDAQLLAAHNRAAVAAQCAPDGTAWVNVKTDRVLCARGSMRLKGER